MFRDESNTIMTVELRVKRPLTIGHDTDRSSTIEETSSSSGSIKKKYVYV